MSFLANVEIRKRLKIKEDLLHKLMKRKLELFGHIARMDNSRKITSLVMGMMDGDNRKGSGLTISKSGVRRIYISYS